ncbi:MAG: SH3 domain-containing protein [Bdellovibrionales bacterium]
MRVLLIALFLFSMPAYAQQKDNPFRSTAYPLPRFVTVASNEAYVRTGPGRKYPIQWVFRRSGLPVEITLEFDHWRRIQDHEGQIGWIHKSLLSGRRHAMIQSQDTVSLMHKPDQDSRLIALLEPDVISKIDECRAEWCRVDASGYKGWVEKENLWGVYPQEIFEN